MEEDDDDHFISMEAEASGAQCRTDDEEFPFTVLSADKIVQNMVDSIKEVNAVVEVKLNFALYINYFNRLNSYFEYNDQLV